MRYVKDGELKGYFQLKQLYPNLSFPKNSPPDGWQVYTPPEPTEEELAERERAILDAITVTRFQAKAALMNAGLLDQFEAYMQQESTPALVKLAWAEAGFNRGSNMVKSIGAEFGLTEQQLDDLFLAAQQIEV